MLSTVHYSVQYSVLPTLHYVCLCFRGGLAGYFSVVENGMDF